MQFSNKERASATRLSVRQLETLRALMLSGTTTRAASALGASQSAVSRVIGELEARLGMQLFVRGHGRLTPTEDAEWLFHEAQDLLARLDNLGRAARDIRYRAVGEMRIVSTPALAYGLAPECLRRMQRTFANLHASLQITFRREVRMWTDTQGFDIALTTMPVDYPKAHTEHLVRVRGVCILPKGHPLSRKKVVSAADLADEPFIAPLPEAVTRFRLDQMFDKARVRRTKQTLHSHTDLTISLMVSAGLGVAIIDPFTANTFNKLGFDVRAFVPKLEFDYGLLFPIRRPRSYLVNVFAQTAREALSENPVYAAGL
jgi:DNA-binding transcriptional LysR family regulator